MDLPIIADVTSNHVAYSDTKVLTITYTPEMLELADGKCTALGLAIKLLTEPTPSEQLLPVMGSEFAIHGDICKANYWDVDYIELL